MLLVNLAARRGDKLQKPVSVQEKRSGGPDEGNGVPSASGRRSCAPEAVLRYARGCEGEGHLRQSEQPEQGKAMGKSGPSLEKGD